MNTSELSKKIVSKIWYYVENPESEQHSGKKLIDLIENSFSDNDTMEIKQIIETKDENRFATLNNLIENKLLESSEFQKQAKYLAFLNDKRLGIKNESFGDEKKPSFLNVLLKIFLVLSIIGRFMYGEGIFSYIAVFALLVLIFRSFSK